MSLLQEVGQNRCVPLRPKALVQAAAVALHVSQLSN